MPSIYFIRHGQREDFENPAWRETAANPDDTPLSATGFQQAEDIARFLADREITVLLSSPFLRTLETARPLAQTLGHPLWIEPGFCEWLNPAWFPRAPRWMSAGQIHTAFPESDPSYVPLLKPSYPEETESPVVYERCGEVLGRLVDRWPDRNTAIFSHGSPSGQSIARLLGTLEGIDLHVGAITQIEFHTRPPRLVTSGRTHLRHTDESLRFH